VKSKYIQGLTPYVIEQVLIFYGGEYPYDLTEMIKRYAKLN